METLKERQFINATERRILYFTISENSYTIGFVYWLQWYVKIVWNIGCHNFVFEIHQTQKSICELLI